MGTLESGTGRIPLQYWSDTLCIWAFVAQDKLERLLMEKGPILDVAYRIIPVFGSVPHRFREGSWAQKGPEGRVAATRRVAHERGHTEVTGEIWRTDPPASSWAVGAVVKAAFALEAAGRLNKGTAAAFQLRLRRRFFVDNVNVARRAYQMEAAEAEGIPVVDLEARLDDGSALAALYEDYLEKETLKLQGSPTYVFDGGRAQLYGNFDHAILDATLASLERGLEVGGTEC